MNRERLVAAARQLRDAGALGRADVLVRLFDFLLECSLAGRAPKEAEIAHTVFGKDAPHDMVEDASVRVYIHRLRRKLDEYHAGLDATASRLAVPRGEYRLVLIAPVDAASPMADPPADNAADRCLTAGRSGHGIGRRELLGLGLLSAVNLAGWGIWARRGPADAFEAVGATDLWRSFASGKRPVLVVAGDYFVVGDAPGGSGIKRLVREPAINSREDLDRYLIDYPAMVGRYRDLALRYLPAGILQALQLLLPLAEGAARRGKVAVRTTLMSRLTPEQPTSVDMLYVGLLDGLGLLREPLSGVSTFRMGDAGDLLIDSRGGARYAADALGGDGDGPPRRDFSYLASWAGPAGDRIMIVAGMRDAGAMQAAQIAADPARLAQIAARTGHAEAFEAVFEVHAIGNVDLNSTLLVARSLRDRGAIRPGDYQPRLPASPAPPSG